MMTAPDFGKDLQRGFEVHENCFDCAAFYDGCTGWRASREFGCRDFNRLPDVGIDGKLGQEFPPARRRTNAGPEPAPEPEPIKRQPAGSSQGPAIEQDHASTPTTGRQQSPAARYGLDGQRLCACGTILKKRARCCESCRRERREKTLQRRRGREQPLEAIHAG